MKEAFLQMLPHLTPLELALIIGINALSACIVKLFIMMAKSNSRIAALERLAGVVEGVATCNIEGCPHSEAARNALETNPASLPA
jgi:hypothetical protein